MCIAFDWCFTNPSVSNCAVPAQPAHAHCNFEMFLSQICHIRRFLQAVLPFRKLCPLTALSAATPAPPFHHDTHHRQCQFKRRNFSKHGISNCCLSSSSNVSPRRERHLDKLTFPLAGSIVIGSETFGIVWWKDKTSPVFSWVK